MAPLAPNVVTPVTAPPAAMPSALVKPTQVTLPLAPNVVTPDTAPAALTTKTPPLPMLRLPPLSTPSVPKLVAALSSRPVTPLIAPALDIVNPVPIFNELPVITPDAVTAPNTSNLTPAAAVFPIPIFPTLSMRMCSVNVFPAFVENVKTPGTVLAVTVPSAFASIAAAVIFSAAVAYPCQSIIPSESPAATIVLLLLLPFDLTNANTPPYASVLD